MLDWCIVNENIWWGWFHRLHFVVRMSKFRGMMLMARRKFFWESCTVFLSFAKTDLKLFEESLIPLRRLSQEALSWAPWSMIHLYSNFSPSTPTSPSISFWPPSLILKCLFLREDTGCQSLDCFFQKWTSQQPSWTIQKWTSKPHELNHSKMNILATDWTV